MATAKVKLRVGLAGAEFSYAKGDIGTFDVAEAFRLVDANYAEFVGAEPARPSRPKAAVDEVGQPGTPTFETLGVSARVAKALRDGGVATPADAAAKSDDDLVALKGVTAKAVADLRKALGQG
jgi:pyridoxal biosynthesis lyase PdxS